MAESKKRIRFEAEAPLPVKIMPAQKAARKPGHREEEPLPFDPAEAAASAGAYAEGYTGDDDRKQVILRIIDFFKAN